MVNNTPTMVIKAKRSCSCNQPGWEFDLVKYQVIRVPEHIGQHLLKLDYAERFEASEWTLRINPFRYLQLYPSGPHAKLAKQVLGIPEVRPKQQPRELQS